MRAQTGSFDVVLKAHNLPLTLLLHEHVAFGAYPLHWGRFMSNNIVRLLNLSNSFRGIAVGCPLYGVARVLPR